MIYHLCFLIYLLQHMFLPLFTPSLTSSLKKGRDVAGHQATCVQLYYVQLYYNINKKFNCIISLYCIINCYMYYDIIVIINWSVYHDTLSYYQWLCLCNTSSWTPCGHLLLPIKGGMDWPQAVQLQSLYSFNVQAC